MTKCARVLPGQDLDLYQAKQAAKLAWETAEARAETAKDKAMKPGKGPGEGDDWEEEKSTREGGPEDDEVEAAVAPVEEPDDILRDRLAARKFRSLLEVLPLAVQQAWQKTLRAGGPQDRKAQSAIIQATMALNPSGRGYSMREDAASHPLFTESTFQNEESKLKEGSEGEHQSAYHMHHTASTHVVLHQMRGDHYMLPEMHRSEGEHHSTSHMHHTRSTHVVMHQMRGGHSILPEMHPQTPCELKCLEPRSMTFHDGPHAPKHVQYNTAASSHYTMTRSLPSSDPE